MRPHSRPANRALATLATAALCSPVAPLGAQTVVPASSADLTFFAPFVGDFAGSVVTGQVALLGDLDDDGMGEFLLSCATTQTATGAGPGVTYVVSGMTNLPMYTFRGNPLPPGAGFDQLGTSAGNAGDVNADGVNDIVIGSHSPLELRRGLVYSGLTGELLFTYTTPFNGPFGAAVAGLGDLDSDGHADVGVADAQRTIVFAGSGKGVYAATLISPAPGGDVNADGFDDFVGVSGFGLVVVSGRTGEGMWLILQPSSVIGRKCMGVGDLNADGKGDFAGCWPEGVRVYSGADQSLILTLADGRTDNARSVFAAGDIDRDGVGDILVASPASATQDGEVRLYAGRTGAHMRTFTEPTHTEFFAFAFGGAIGAGEDVNNDAIPDVAVRSFRALGGAGEDGPVAYIFFSPQPCPTDVTFDRVTGFADLNLVLAQFGQSNAYPAPSADIDLDHTVAFADLNLVLSAFGSACE